jgi:hypothetical protein
MTPEQIAQMMTEDITTNNGLKPSVKTQIIPDRPRQRRNLQEEWDRYHYDNYRYHEMPYQPYDQVPTRVSILPKSAYVQPFRKKPKPQPRQTEKVGLGRRMIIM